MVFLIVVFVVGLMVIIVRLIWLSMVEVLIQDYICIVKVKGFFLFKIIVKYVFRNVFMFVIIVLGIFVVSILIGSFVIEKIFVILGMGKYFVESINQWDYFVIMGMIVFYSVILIIMLFLVDLVYGLLDLCIKLYKKG